MKVLASFVSVQPALVSAQGRDRRDRQDDRWDRKEVHRDRREARERREDRREARHENRRWKTLGTIIGAGGGALIGRAIDNGDIVCR